MATLDPRFAEGDQAAFLLVPQDEANGAEALPQGQPSHIAQLGPVPQDVG